MIIFMNKECVYGLMVFMVGSSRLACKELWRNTEGLVCRNGPHLGWNFVQCKHLLEKLQNENNDKWNNLLISEASDKNYFDTLCS